MEKAIWLAGVFGPFMAILGLWMLWYHENVAKVWTAVKNNPGLFYCNSVTNFFVGIVVLSLFNMWTWNLSVLVSLLGWVMLIRGLLGLFIPQIIVKWVMTNGTWMRVMGIVPLIWGLLLCTLAFFP